MEKHKSHITEGKIVIYWNAKRIASWFLAILIVPVFLVFLFSVVHKQTLANPEFYKDNLQKADTYNQLLNEGIPSLIMEAKISDNASMNIFAKKAIIYVIKNSIPADWVQAQTENIIDAVANYIRNPKDTSSITIRMENFQQYLTQISDGLVIAEQIIPSCADAQNSSGVLSQLLNVSIDCANMKTDLDDIKANIAQARTEIDKISVESLNLTQGVQQATQSIDVIHNFFYIFKIFIWVSLVLVIVFALLILWIDRAKIATAVKFISLPIVVSSALTLIFGLIASNIDIIKASELQLNLPDAMNNIIYNLIDVNIMQYFVKLETVAAIFLVIFVIIYILTILAERKIIDFSHWKHHKK